MIIYHSQVASKSSNKLDQDKLRVWLPFFHHRHDEISHHLKNSLMQKITACPSMTHKVALVPTCQDHRTLSEVCPSMTHKVALVLTCQDHRTLSEVAAILAS